MPLLTLLLNSAHAGDDVLWYWGNDGYDAVGEVDALETAVLAAGATGFDELTAWPASLADYQLILMDLPQTAFTAGQTADIEAFIGTGGVVVLIGDNDTSFSAVNVVHNALLADLGYATRFLDDTLETGCSHYGTVVVSHTYTDGYSLLEYAASGDLALGSGATTLVEGESGQPLLAVEGSLVLSTDINIFIDSCGLGATHDALFAALLEDLCVTNSDRDGDGFDGEDCGGDDCDDGDAAVNPDGVETCNGADDDCEGTADGTDALGRSSWYPDDDGDGWGDGMRVSLEACDAPSGYVADATDCDDRDRTARPDGTEVCDGADDDCDGAIDDDASDASTWYRDADGDGYGTRDGVLVVCEIPEGYCDNTRDCDDASAANRPGAVEVCDGVDNDCDYTPDNDAVDALPWYVDVDGDGYAGPDAAEYACSQPAGLYATGEDCDDQEQWVHPGADEYCDDRDEDCDGEVDEGALNAPDWYADADGDGYGDPDVVTQECDQVGGTVSDATDCDDADPDAWPGAPGWSLFCEPLDTDVPGEEEDTGGDKAPESCGCAAGPSAAWMGMALAGLALGLRRRGD